jgi:hypothetical protein
MVLGNRSGKFCSGFFEKICPFFRIEFFGGKQWNQIFIAIFRCQFTKGFFKMFAGLSLRILV